MPYNPYQLLALQYALQFNPSLVQSIRGSVRGDMPDENTGKEAGQAAYNRYIAAKVAPVQGAQAAVDGPSYASSFAQQRQADIGGAGALEAGAAQTEAQNAELDRRMRLYQIRKQQEDQDWQDLFGPGGPLASFKNRLEASTGGGASGRPSVQSDYNENGQPSTLENIARIGTGVAQLGKQYMDARSQGKQPIVAFGQGVGQVARDVVSAPQQLWGGIKRGFFG